MKCNVKIEISDEARRALSSLLAGKPVKRLATRDEVNAYLLGTVAGLMREGGADLGQKTVEASQVVDAIRRPFTAAEQREVERLQAEGRSEGYIRGWVYAGRRLP